MSEMEIAHLKPADDNELHESQSNDGGPLPEPKQEPVTPPRLSQPLKDDLQQDPQQELQEDDEQDAEQDAPHAPHDPPQGSPQNSPELEQRQKQEHEQHHYSEPQDDRHQPEQRQKQEHEQLHYSGPLDVTHHHGLITQPPSEQHQHQMHPHGNHSLNIQQTHHNHVDHDKENEEDVSFDEKMLQEPQALDPEVIAQNELIKRSQPTTELEMALMDALKRKDSHIARLTGEVTKLKAFISKRKQTYKRKRKDEGAPTRALSAYNIFVQERFARLAKENEQALKSADTDAQLKRVPPANLVASTGNEWKELTAEEKAKYEERAKADRKRYEDQMAEYQPPDKQANRKRNKTGYNMFFSAHVLRLKQSESGVPSERGSVARLVGLAWKQLSSDEKQFYEREADKHNGMNPVKEDEEEEDEEAKRQQMEQYQMHQVHAGAEMHMHGGMAPPMQMQHPQHDPRAHHAHAYYAPHMYAQPAYAHYDYSHHHQRHPQGRNQAYAQSYPPPPGRHPYDNSGMQM